MTCSDSTTAAVDDMEWSDDDDAVQVTSSTQIPDMMVREGLSCLRLLALFNEIRDVVFLFTWFMLCLQLLDVGGRDMVVV